ncbi:MAG: tRNA guanosine(34) transglycosylase Tgt [Patescibacteria group bacterium]
MNKSNLNKKAGLKNIKTAHGSLKLPIFLPDATRGIVKLCSSQDLRRVGIKAMVVNTFHLLLQPGMKIIKKAGGAHKFMNWHGPLVSDSGGFQIFSLIHQNPKMGRIYDDRVIFKSPLDGSKHELTPEKSIQIQFDLGVDMMVCLDDCPPNDFNQKDIARSVERTIVWAKKCKVEYEKQVKKRNLIKPERPLLLSVIQGGQELDLRKKCADELISIGFDGYGFGGRPIDKKGRFLSEALSYTADLIPDNSLRFALGIGLPEDIVRCANMGWHIFDCTIPTREGRHGRLFNIRSGNEELRIKNFYNTININNSRFANDFSPINENSRLPELRDYSKAYLHHLFKIKESFGQRLASLNNLEFYSDLMKKIKK